MKTTQLSLQTRKSLAVAAATLKQPVPAVFVNAPTKRAGVPALLTATPAKVEQADELKARVEALEAEVAALRAEQAKKPTGAAAVIEQLARERVERELAALVTKSADTEVCPPKRRWWQW